VARRAPREGAGRARNGRVVHRRVARDERRAPLPLESGQPLDGRERLSDHGLDRRERSRRPGALGRERRGPARSRARARRNPARRHVHRARRLDLRIHAHDRRTPTKDVRASACTIHVSRVGRAPPRRAEGVRGARTIHAPKRQAPPRALNPAISVTIVVSS
jgi:hypothetical protein